MQAIVIRGFGVTGVNHPRGNVVITMDAAA